MHVEYTYQIQADDLVFAEEFRRQPIGHHSPGLQRILSLFRGAPLRGKHVILCTKPHRQWILGELAGSQGLAIRLHKDKVFRSLAEAEWDVFKLRWKRHTGKDLERELARACRTGQIGR
jgi:branched-chain amino acid transport system permease protein